MNTDELIHKMEKARTKDDLEALGIEHLGVDVDKRKTKEVLRAELIGKAESRVDSAAPQPQEELTEPAPSQEPSQAPEPAEPTPAPSAPTPSGYAGRRGRNLKTGRIMAWSSAMASMPHMEEL